jgi:hypothetical protein
VYRRMGVARGLVEGCVGFVYLVRDGWSCLMEAGLVVGFEFLLVGLPVAASPLLLAGMRELLFDLWRRLLPACPFPADPSSAYDC